MLLRNAWFIVTSDEIGEIQGYLERLDEQDNENRSRNIRAIEQILARVEHRLA